MKNIKFTLTMSLYIRLSLAVPYSEYITHTSLAVFTRIALNKYGKKIANTMSIFHIKLKNSRAYTRLFNLKLLILIVYILQIYRAYFVLRKSFVNHNVVDAVFFY